MVLVLVQGRNAEDYLPLCVVAVGGGGQLGDGGENLGSLAVFKVLHHFLEKMGGVGRCGGRRCWVD